MLHHICLVRLIECRALLLLVQHDKSIVIQPESAGAMAGASLFTHLVVRDGRCRSSCLRVTSANSPTLMMAERRPQPFSHRRSSLNQLQGKVCGIF